MGSSARILLGIAGAVAILVLVFLLGVRQETTEPESEPAFVRRSAQQEDEPRTKGPTRSGAADRGTISPAVPDADLREYGEWRGQVLNEELLPIADATVLFGKSLSRHRTDEHGEFVISHPDVRRQTLLLSAPEHVTRRFDLVPPGHHLRVVLRAATSFEGTLRREDGSPVASASLELTPIGHPDLRPAKRKSGEDGTFRFQDLNPGRYDLVVTHESLAPTRDLSVTVPPGGLLRDYTMTSGAELLIKAMVLGTSQGVSGVILRIREQTVEPSHVHLIRPKGPYVTDGAGEVRLYGLTPGRITILARARGFGASLLTTEVLPEKNEQRADVFLPQERSAKLQVQNADGSPATEALLVIKSLDTDMRTWNELASFLLGTEPLRDDVGDQWPSLRTDRRGRAELTGLPPFGRMEIRALDSEENQAPSDSLVLDLKKPLGEEEFVLTLHAGRTLVGTVVNEEGAPIPYAVVTCAGVRTETDRSGNFRLGAAPISEANIAADHPGYERTLQVLPKGDQAPILLRMKRGAWVQGLVADENGLPIYGAFVAAVLPSNQLESTQTNFLGAFELGNLHYPTADLFINAIGYEPQVIKQVETIGALLRIPLVRDPVSPGASVRFRVVNARTGVGLPYARVTMPSARQFEHVGERWWIKNLTPGVHAFRIQAAGYEERHVGDVILGPGMDVDLADISLKALGSATFVLQTRGEVLREAELTFVVRSDTGNEYSPLKRVRGVHDGKPTYRFDRLPEGSYRIIVAQRDLKVEQAFEVPNETADPIPLLLLPW